MSDIFISYKREEQPIARKLADALKGEGWTVWWDPKLRAGEHFDDVIEKALNEAKCVVVIWSEQSVQSRYIRAEATYALDRDKLVPVAIEKVNLPFRFRGVHTLNLLGWSGSKDFTDFRRLVDDLSTILGPSPVATAEEQRRLEADEHRKMEKERLGEQKKEEVKRKAEEERLPEQERQPSEVEARPKTERQNQNRRQFYAGGAVGIAVVAMTVWLSSGGKDGDVNKIVSLGIQGKRQLKVGEKSVLRAVGRFSDGRENRRDKKFGLAEQRRFGCFSERGWTSRGA